MKLPELKKHFKNKYTIRIMAGVLVVALAGTGVSASTVNAAKNDTAVERSESTEKEETEDHAKAGEDEKSSLLSELLGDGVKVGEREVGKEETVYVISDSTGAARSVIVSDHLINRDGAAVLSDASTLKGITNVKGEETYTQNGTEVTWNAGGNDIYYQGTAAGQLPVTQKITYLLDGKEIAPEELAGKSGRVTIRFDYTNNEKTEVTIDGRREEICVPFMAVSGMVLDESFRNIEVTNGKVTADGNKSVVFGYALPGLSDSLDVDEKDFDGDVRIPEYFEVTADVEDFSLDMAMTVVVNAASLLDAEGEDGLSSVDEMLDTLTDATAQLADGSAELAEGSDTLKDGMGEFTDGVRTLKDGVSAYTDGASKLADGIAQLSGKTPELSTGVDTLNSSAATLYQGISLLDNTLNAAFTEQEKENLQKQVSDTVAAQEQTIKDSAKSAVDAQAEAIKGQAEAAVDAQAEAIKGQAEAAVDAQAEALKGQAEAAVDAQAEAIKGQAKQAVDDTFAGGQYAAIEAQASGQVAASLTSQESVAAVTEGIKQTDAYYYMAQGIRAAALQAVMDQSGGTITNWNDAAAAFQAANGISVDDFAAAQASDATAQLASGVMTQIASNAAPAMGKSVADTALLVAETTAQDAAVTGAKAAAGMAAVTGAKSAAGTAAVTGAKAAAGTAAVSGAKAAAGTAAVSGAAEAAQTAAFEGAKSAAKTAAVSAAEQTKKTIAGSIEAQTDSGYSLMTGMKALAEGTQSLQNAMPSLISGVNQLSDGSKTLVGNNAALNDGAKKLSDGAGDIADGVGQLSEGAHQLADGVVEFNEKGIEKILNAYNGDIEPLVERIQAVLDAGADYQTYTGLADGMEGSVRFVYKTAAVKGN